MILLSSFYNAGNEHRDAELLECWKRNEHCPAFEKIYRFVDADHDELYSSGKLADGDILIPLPESKTIIVAVGSRSTYRAYFDFANRTFAPGTVVCLSNADIWFDETLLNINGQQLDGRTFFACSRWGFMDELGGWHWNEGYDKNAPVAQDAWIFRTPIEWKREVNTLDFEFGHMRCDNVLAWTMQQSGYRVINPTYPGPKSLKLHHEHRSQAHNYGAAIPGPMIFVHPCQLG